MTKTILKKISQNPNFISFCNRILNFKTKKTFYLSENAY